MDEKKGFVERTSFVRILSHDFSNHLQLPYDFTETFNGNVPSRFYVESSMNKKCWRVEVEEDVEGTIYLRDGWNAFAKAHCLEVGDVVLFEYVEQSIFQVKIFGQSGCLKNTFVDRKESGPTTRKVIDIEEDTEGESFECEPQNSIESRPKRTKNISTLKDNNTSYIKRRATSRGRRKTKSSKVGENETSFSICLRKKYQFLTQTIPMAVGFKNKLTDEEEVVLQDPKGNRWPVRLGHKRTGHVLFIRGWKQFLKGNNIVIGDALNFKFTSQKLIEVHVARSSKRVDNHHHREANFCSSTDGNGDCVEPRCNYATEDVIVVDSVTPKKAECELKRCSYATEDVTVVASVAPKKAGRELKCSSFSFPWYKKRTRSYLYIPKAIAREQNLKNKENVALRDTNGKYWPLEVKTWYDGRVALTKGWVEFCEGLAIKNGDTLEFEFVSPRRIQISIHKRDHPHEIIIDDATVDEEVTTTKGSANVLLDSGIAMGKMDIKGFASDLLALTKEHYPLQTPPGFQPIKQRVP